MKRDAKGERREAGKGSGCAAALALLLCAALAGAAGAQTYPAKPIRFVVGYVAGGGTDRISRALSQKLSERMGQTVIVDNRPGGGGMIAAVTVAKAPPDGYTLFAGTPRAIVDRLHREIAKALQAPELTERLAAEGSTPGGITPEEFAAHIRSEIAKWAKVVRASGARAD